MLVDMPPHTRHSQTGLYTMDIVTIPLSIRLAALAVSAAVTWTILQSHAQIHGLQVMTAASLQQLCPSQAHVHDRCALTDESLLLLQPNLAWPRLCKSCSSIMLVDSKTLLHVMQNDPAKAVLLTR